VRRLPDPRALLLRRAAELAGQDRGERLALRLVAAVVDVEAVRPRRARLVVVVAAHEHGGEAGEVDVAGMAVAHDPRQCAGADPERRAPAGHAADAPARADRLAVARLEVAAGDRPRIQRVVGHRREPLTTSPLADDVFTRDECRESRIVRIPRVSRQQLLRLATFWLRPAFVL